MISRTLRLYGAYMSTALKAMLVSMYVFLWIGRPIVTLGVTTLLLLIIMAIALAESNPKVDGSPWPIMAEVVHNVLPFGAIWMIFAPIVVRLAKLTKRGMTSSPKRGMILPQRRRPARRTTRRR
jgi:hypothetical protein